MKVELNPITIVRNLYALWRFSIGKFPEEFWSSYEAKMRLVHLLKGKPKLHRNLLAKGLKENRRFEIDKERAANIHKRQFFIKTHCNNFSPTQYPEINRWVVLTTTEYPVKGDRYKEYFFNGFMGELEGIYKVKTEIVQGDDYKEVELHGIRNGFTFPVICMRYATDEEIAEAKSNFNTEKMERMQAINNSFDRQREMIEEDYTWLID